VQLRVDQVGLAAGALVIAVLFAKLARRRYIQDDTL
jgi:hypothetical protein